MTEFRTICKACVKVDRSLPVRTKRRFFRGKEVWHIAFSKTRKSFCGRRF